MLEFQEKRKARKMMYSWVTILILFIIFAFLLNSVWKVYKKQKITQDNLQNTATDLDSLKEREKKLSTEIGWLKTEGGTESEIRDKYGLVKPGEEVIVIVDKKDDKNSATESIEKSFWQKIVDMLK
jgi:cell division protein FtsB